MWLRTGLPVVLQTDLATAAKLAVSLVETQSQAYQLAVPEVLRTTVELRDHQWRITVTTVDLSSQLLSDSFAVTGPESAGVIAVADAVAKHLDGRSSPFSTHRDSALQAYVQGVTAADQNSRMGSLAKAVELDPGFGLAYFSAIDTVSQSNPVAAENLLKQASTQKARFSPLDRARLDAISARLSHMPLANQVSSSAELLRLTPNSLDALVSLASLRFLQGDGSAGKQLLQRALSLSPGNLTVQSFLALGLLQTSHFREAEARYELLEANPANLPNLAVCVLLEGDAARADSIFARYLKLQESSGDPALPLIHANWLALVGKLQEAVTLLKGAQFSSRDVQSLAQSQAAVWELMQNDRANAQTDAAASLLTASSPPVMALASAASAIITAGQSSASLTQRVNAAALNKDQKAIVLAYGLFLNRHFSEAADCWRTISNTSGGADLRSRAMLAASRDRAALRADAAALPVEPFIPNVAAGDQYAAIAFAEMRRLLSR